MYSGSRSIVRAVACGYFCSLTSSRTHAVVLVTGHGRPEKLLCQGADGRLDCGCGKEETLQKDNRICSKVVRFWSRACTVCTVDTFVLFHFGPTRGHGIN